jgi:hypothetical protein
VFPSCPLPYNRHEFLACVHQSLLSNTAVCCPCAARPASLDLYVTLDRQHIVVRRSPHGFLPFLTCYSDLISRPWHRRDRPPHRNNLCRTVSAPNFRSPVLGASFLITRQLMIMRLVRTKCLSDLSVKTIPGIASQSRRVATLVG